MEGGTTLSNFDFPNYFFDHTSYSILYLNAQREIIYVNKATCDMLGLSKKEMLGKKMDFFRSERYNEAFYNAMWKNVHEHGSWEGEIWNRRSNGELYLGRRTIVLNQFSENTDIKYIIFGRDITREKENEIKVNDIHFKDHITGLPVKHVFDQIYLSAAKRAKKKKKKMAILLVDIHNFRRVNNHFGFAAADKILKDVGVRLQQQAGDEATVSRIAGDLFLILLPYLNTEESVLETLEKVTHSFKNEPFYIENHELFLDSHMGVSFYPNNGTTEKELISKADLARYRAKESHVDNYQFYTSELNVKVFEKLALESSLRLAVEKKEFVLYYQPQVHLETNKVTGVEALIRWEHPELGLISPGKFIPIAEETGLIVPIGVWVMEEACKQIAEWDQKGMQLTIGLNLSAIHFSDKQLIPHLKRILDTTKIDPSLLEIEITESMMITNIEQTIEVIRELKKLGVFISVDDFGTGYSSLNYLAKLPIDFLKIDRSFMNHGDEKGVNATIASSIITLSKKLGLAVVAEGVEMPEQVEFLRKEKCDYIQGYFLSQPLPKKEIESYIRHYNKE